MRKRMLMIGFVFFVAIAVTATAYACADNPNCAVHGFFNSVGGFLYNALPWNWGNWWGK